VSWHRLEIAMLAPARVAAEAEVYGRPARSG
jgi:hypothetical protein